MSCDLPKRASNTVPPPLLHVAGQFESYPDTSHVVAETDHFRILSRDDKLPVSHDWFTNHAERVFTYVSGRLETPGKLKINVAFGIPKNHWLTRGLTRTDSIQSDILIIVDENTSTAQILGVLAHETAHVIHAKELSHGGSADGLLREGLASWAAGEYYETWHDIPSIHGAVRHVLNANHYLPLSDLHTPPRSFTVHADSVDSFRIKQLERRDVLYTEAASFIGYLVRTYGMKKLKVLCQRSPPFDRTGESNVSEYAAVYGRSVDELEQDWLKFVSKYEGGTTGRG